MKTKQRYIQIEGARENNLKDISLKIPKNKLVVITGVSGSGKSSLAFDTIYAEGQRRYLETFSVYAHQFIGKMERPDVEKIDGLSPVISIEQKTTGWNPRSTVGTTTEVYDFLRLLFARAGEAYSYVTGKKMIKYTEQMIIDAVQSDYSNQKINVLAPLVIGRKGHYRELFEQLRKQGYTKVRIDEDIKDLVPGLKVERYKAHNIELVVDRLKVDESKLDRLRSSIQLALKRGSDMLYILKEGEEHIRIYSKRLMCSDSGISYKEPSPHSFSFNSPEGACPDCRGLGTVQEVDLDKVIPDDKLSINEGGIGPIGERRENSIFKQLEALGKAFSFSLASPIKDIPPRALEIILHGGGDKELKVPIRKRDSSENLIRHGIIKMLEKWHRETSSDKIRNWAEDFMSVRVCNICGGTRLKKESLYFKIADKNIAELASMDMSELGTWLEVLPSKLSERQLLIAKDIVKELHHRVSFLLHVGLDYLHLNRPAKSLSGGESQRTRLATQIGSKLTGVTYILDEPSIGLHQRDNHRLIEALKDLSRVGNSVLVVEHDKDIMLASDYLVDLGPGAGRFGGEIVAEGQPDELKKMRSLTMDYLSGVKEISLPEERRKGTGEFLRLYGAEGHNLKGVNLEIPLGTMCCVTGVSGSGKSTLIRETLYPLLKQKVYNSSVRPLAHDRIEGMEHIDKVVEIDQSPIGRTPRSNPATYTGCVY